MFDEIDLQILETLQQDARISNAQMARDLGMAPSAVLERVRKLEAKGVIRSYEGRLDPRAVDLTLLAFIFVRAEEPPGQLTAGEALAEMPNVLEVHHVAGEDCYLVKVRSRDPESLGRLLRQEIGSIDTVRSTRTTIVLETVRESSRLPLPEPEDA